MHTASRFFRSLFHLDGTTSVVTAFVTAASSGLVVVFARAPAGAGASVVFSALRRNIPDAFPHRALSRPERLVNAQIRFLDGGLTVFRQLTLAVARRLHRLAPSR